MSFELEADYPDYLKRGVSRVGAVLKRWGLILLGTILLVIYLTTIDFSDLLAVSTRLRPIHVVSVLLLNLLPGAVKLFRWNRLLEGQPRKRGVWNDYLAVNAGFYLGLITPGTSGEVSRGLISHSVDGAAGVAVVVFEKATDLASLLLLAVFCVLIWLHPNMTGIVLSVVTVGLAVLIVLTAPLLLSWVRPAGKKVLRRIIGADNFGVTGRAYSQFENLVRSRKFVAESLAVSTVLWAIPFLQISLIFQSLDWHMPYHEIGVVFFLPYLIGVLSFIPMGLGAFDLTLSKALTLLSISGQAASAITLTPLVFRLLISVPLIGIGYLSHLVLTLSASSDR